MLSRILVLRALLLAATLGAASQTSAGFLLTAEVYDTPGLPGYQTFDLTASSAEGYVNAFSFYGRDDGITGPLHQGGVDPDPLSAHWSDSLFAGRTDDPADSRWLVGTDVGLQIGGSQSDASLHAAYAFTGIGGERNTYRSLPFARLVTNDPSAVRLKGEFLFDRFWADGTSLGMATHAVDTRLSDIAVGQAPTYDGLPAVPADVVAEREEAERVRMERHTQRLAEQRARDLAHAENQRRLVDERLAREAALEAALEAERLAAEADRLAREAEIPPIPTTPIERTPVTVEDYQTGLDQRAEQIRLQIEQLQAQLEEVTDHRVASEAPGFEVPIRLAGRIDLATGQRITPAYTLPDELVSALGHDATRLTFQSLAAIDLSSSRSFTIDVAQNVAYDTDAFSLNAIRQLTLAPANTATPEPGSGVLVLLAAGSLLRRR